MKTRILLSIFLFAIIFLAACKGEKKQDNQASQGEAVKTECTYSLQPAYTQVNWTAYKTMARVGVKGKFDKLSFEPGSEDGTVKELMQNLSFTIHTSSINSENPERDGKLVEHFFQAMTDTEEINGEISSINGTDSTGSARIAIQMNGLSAEVDAEYVFNGQELVLEAKIEMGDWKAEPAMSSLAEVCGELHTGEDGVSKFWPDIDIRVASTLKKNCPDLES